MVDKLGPFVGTDFFLVFSLFHFLPVTLNLAYFAPLNAAGWISPVNFNYQRCLENSNMINVWLTSWVPLWGQIFLVFSLFSLFTHYFEFSLLCTRNGANRIFPVNFNYQRCLENSNMVRFWLTSWVPLWGQIFLVFFSLFAPDKSG